MDGTLAIKQMDRRAATIIRSVRNLSPKSDSIRELVELAEALSDQPVKPVVVARLTVTRQNGIRTIVEVHADARFHSFYHYFHQEGNRRSTKRSLRTANRNEGISWLKFEPLHPVGLETIAHKLEKYAALVNNPVVSTKIRIIQRRAYRRLLSISPDQLGLGQMTRRPFYNPAHS